MPNKLKTIAVKVYQEKVEERLANAALSPGHLLKLMVTNKFKKHDIAQGRVKPLFIAVEDENQGKGINDAYAAADVVRAIVALPGDIVNVLLDDGQTIVIGDELCSNGDGTVKKFVLTGDSSDLLEAEAERLLHAANCVIGIATEALDLSGSSGTESDDLRAEQHIAMMVV
jgi:hypothetical protein